MDICVFSNLMKTFMESQKFTFILQFVREFIDFKTYKRLPLQYKQCSNEIGSKNQVFNFYVKEDG